MHSDKSPVTIRDKADRNTGYWCLKLISVCYITIVINLLVLIVIWYLFSFNTEGHDLAGYWMRYIILPSSAMLIANIAADVLVRADWVSLTAKKYISIFLMLVFCTLLCMQHTIVAVLLTSFIVPVMLSTLYANIKITRRTHLLAQVLLILSSLRMHASASRDFGPWIWMEMLTASGLLLASYFLAEVLIIYGRDTISNLHTMEKDKMELEEELKLDPLTGLYNRKAYDEYLPRIMEECRLANKNLSMAVLDIDDFKQVNDVYGHAAGDRVLLQFSEILKRLVHERIDAFRVGGEEFVLLFKGYSVHEAVKVCESVLIIMKEVRMSELDGRVITFSGGVADMASGKTDPLELFRAADAALYAAKQSGKNKIAVQKDSKI
ncbi:MAG: GGDEF domain-containing protein [Lacrimispora sp.]|uniref:GGDEF domain-containing protein n=1 Tax=Lacrimispora sp. TaxID=2719234 RepID=UPI0039E514F2